MSEVQVLAQVPGAPMFPQVNLLPPHVKAKRRVAVARSWFGLVVLLVLFAVGLLAVGTQWQLQVAQSDLVSIQDENQALLSEQAKYAEVPQVLKELKARQEARSLAMSSEILWSPYLAAIASTTPLTGLIDNISIATNTVWDPSQGGGEGPLYTPGTIGQASMNGKALTLADVSQWEDSLSALPGIVDVEVTSVEVADQDELVYYAVAATFRFTADALANQFELEQ